MMEDVLSTVKRFVFTTLWAWSVSLLGPAFSATIQLQDIDSGLTSPAGNYRSLDVADQSYSPAYRDSYNYTQADVEVTFDPASGTFEGSLAGTNLKPNFAYQLKVAGTAGSAANELIGLAGRWWQEEWNGSQWANGRNLNDKGTGYSPTPNDETYFARRDVADATSPTGKRYRYTGYLVFDYFITDNMGSVTLGFRADSSYHVLWKSSQRARGEEDGPLKTRMFDPALPEPAYNVDYPQTTVSIFGEWERLPVGGVQLLPGQYACDLFLTEESFHGSGGQYAGGWAAAMGNQITFNVPEPEPELKDVTRSDELISFEIADCMLGATHQVERSFGLEGGGGWETVFSFMATEESTNWSDVISDHVPKAFYRVNRQLP